MKELQFSREKGVATAWHIALDGSFLRSVQKETY